MDHTPTPAQSQGWPPIQRGEHTLILSPTGSGKTLAGGEGGAVPVGGGGAPAGGVHTLYISALKALNNDVQRNLRALPARIRRHARRLGLDAWDGNR